MTTEDNVNRVAKFLESRRQEEKPASEDSMQKAIAAGIAAAMPEIVKAVQPADNTAGMSEILERINAQQAQQAEILTRLSQPAQPDEPKGIDLSVLLEGIDETNRKALDGTPGFAQALAQIAVNAANATKGKDSSDDVAALQERLKQAEDRVGLASIQSLSPRLAKYQNDPKFLASLEQENAEFGIPNQLLYNAAIKSGNVKTLETLFDRFEAGDQPQDIGAQFAAPNTGGHAAASSSKTSFTIEDIELASQQAVDGKISTADLDSMVSAFETQNAA